MTRLTQEHHQLHLGVGTLASGKFERGRLLLVRRGYVWVTQEGRTEDFWLHAGDALLIQPGRMVVIEAALASEIYLENRSAMTLPMWLARQCFAVRNVLQRAALRIGRRIVRTGRALQFGGR